MCGKAEAHVYCPICHHYFHDNPKFLPEGEQKLIAFPIGKRDRDGRPVYGPMVQNTCFHVAHVEGREGMRGERDVVSFPRRIM